jgi:hypothetical protein
LEVAALHNVRASLLYTGHFKVTRALLIKAPFCVRKKLKEKKKILNIYSKPESLQR